MSAPEVSVVMPVYNGAKFLQEAVTSILTQSFAQFELIIVDDCSTDETAALIQDFRDARITYLRNESQCGISLSLNKGLEKSRGTLVARMDADDVSEPNRLMSQVEFMRRHEGVVVCGTEGLKINARGATLSRIARHHTDVAIRFHLLTGNPFIHPSVVYRRAAITKVGGYDSSFACAQDYDLWCRLSRLGEMANLPESLIRYRVHDDTVSTNRRSDQLQHTRNRSCEYLIETGVACSQDEAHVFQQFSRIADLKHTFAMSSKQLVQYIAMIDRFFERFDQSSSTVAAAIAECRARLRRRLLVHASTRIWNFAEALRYVQLARRIDPDGMRLSKVAGRSFRLFNRPMDRAEGSGVNPI